MVGGSAFGKDPGRYGILSYEKERAIHPGWCFGLSIDLPWAMEDASLARAWVQYIERLRELIEPVVDPDFWPEIDSICERIMG
ncbi:hypothetical protein ACFL6C_11040 [Myxococcota bacterium]